MGRAWHVQRPRGPKALDLVRKHPATLTQVELRQKVSEGWVGACGKLHVGAKQSFPIQHHHLGGNAGTKEVEGPRAGVSKTTRSKASRVHWKGHRVMPSSELRVARQSSQCFMRKKDHRFLCEI